MNIGWFSSGRGRGSRAMLEHTVSHIHSHTLDCEIQFVFCHREEGEGQGSDDYLKRVSDLHIPSITISSKRFRENHNGQFAKYREEFDQLVFEAIKPYDVDICVLAGYLLIISPVLLKKGSFINLHPSLPGGPKGLWQEVIWQTIVNKNYSTGAMTFLVSEELDEGPPLAFAEIPLTGPEFQNDWDLLRLGSIEQIKASQGENFSLFQKIRNAQIPLEAPLLTETLRMFADKKIGIQEIHRASDLPIDLTGSMQI